MSVDDVLGTTSIDSFDTDGRNTPKLNDPNLLYRAKIRLRQKNGQTCERNDEWIDVLLEERGDKVR